MIRLGNFDDSIVARTVNCTVFFNCIGQNQPSAERRANDRFVIRKGPLAKDDMNGR
jgi:hypothetical protein